MRLEEGWKGKRDCDRANKIRGSVGLTFTDRRETMRGNSVIYYHTLDCVVFYTLFYTLSQFSLFFIANYHFIEH